MSWKKLVALLAALVLIAAACGGDDDGDEGATESEETTEETAEDTAEEPAEEEAAPTGEAGQGGNLLILQWQAVSLANSYLSSGTKDLQAGSLVLEPLAEIRPNLVLPGQSRSIAQLLKNFVADEPPVSIWRWLEERLGWLAAPPR